MATVKNYLDYAGLQSYDALIKTWANSANQVGYKTILKSADGNTLNLYKKANAVLDTDTADATVDLGSADAAAKLDALASVLGATWTPEDTSTTPATPAHYELGLDSTFNSSVKDAVAALNELKGQINTLNGDDTTAGSVAKAIKDAIDALDVTEFAIAEKDSTTNVITVHGISETDGKIAVGSNTANDITFAAVAATGAASDVSNTAIAGVTKEVSGTNIATTNVQDTLEALKGLIDENASASNITIDEITTGLNSNILKAYQVYVGGTQTAGVTTDGTLVGTINIPKDFLVKSASVEVVSSSDKAVGGKFENNDDFAIGEKYIDFVINTKDTASGSEADEHIYINVSDLVDVYTAQANATEVQLAISASNEISASIVKVSGTKVIYKPAYTDNTNPQNPVDVPEETVVDALNNIQSISSSDINALFA